MGGMQTPPGITECNQSYFSGNSFSVPHSSQQLHHGTPATLRSHLLQIQEVNALASSGVTSSSLLSRSAFSSQVTEAPTRNGTGGVIPLAEAITHISLLEFLQRCGVSIAPHQPSQPPVSNSLLEAAVQTTTPCKSPRMCLRRRLINRTRFRVMWPSRRLSMVPPTLSLDAAAQTTTPSTSS